jgi:hypothetical protein
MTHQNAVGEHSPNLVSYGNTRGVSNDRLLGPVPAENLFASRATAGPHRGAHLHCRRRPIHAHVAIKDLVNVPRVVTLRAVAPTGAHTRGNADAR